MEHETTTPPDAPLVTMLRYHLWANERLIDACAALTPEQLAATVPGTFGPIDRTLYHIFRAEQGYLIDLTDEDPGSPLRPDAALRYEDGFDIDTLRAHARKSAAAFMTIAAGVGPGAISVLGNPEEKTRFPVPTGLLLMQAITHGAEHRIHIAAILTHLGIEPPDWSVWAYLDEIVVPYTID